MMLIFKLILLFYTLQYILAYLFKIKSTVLTCGLWCYVGKEAANEWKLKILALYNQTRGEDSTGVCVDGIISKDTVTAREFFIKKPEVLDFNTYDMKNFAVLGHCRKASFQHNRMITSYAHPHSTKLDGKDFLRLVHNGSISNCWDLSKKYDCDYTDKSDTMLLAEILTKGWKNYNMDVLREYDGSATVIFYPIGMNNSLYVHRDKERELYYWAESKDSCYISSIAGGLAAIGAPASEIKEFTAGHLYKFFGGKITKSWDLTNKTPYRHSIPKANLRRSEHRNNVVTPSKVKKDAAKTNGFYWEDHKILCNGHLYVGEVYIGVDGEKPEKSISKKNKDHYNLYYVIMGIIMKDKKAYEELHNKCTLDNKFNPGLYNTLLLSQVQSYAKFPILGKTYSDSGKQFFWSDETRKLKDVDSEFSWSPPLSGLVFTIGRAGELKGVTEKSAPISIADSIEICLAQKTDSGTKYSTIIDLYNDVKQLAKNKASFTAFQDELLKFLKASTLVTKTRFTRLEVLGETSSYGFAEEQAPHQYIAAFSEILIEYMNAVIELNQRNNSFGDEVEAYVTEQLVDDTFANENEYHYSPTWKNEVLFGDYESLEDIITTYLVTDEKEYVKPLLRALANVFSEVGLLPKADIDSFGKKDPITAKHELSRYFNRLKEEKCLKSIGEVFRQGDTTEGFAKLYEEYIGLAEKQGVTEKERLQLCILKVGLKYIEVKAKTLDKSKLAADYNITSKEIEQIC